MKVVVFQEVVITLNFALTIHTSQSTQEIQLTLVLQLPLQLSKNSGFLKIQLLLKEYFQ